MRDVDDHALRFHRLDDQPSERGEPAFFQAVHRSREVVVEEMGEPRHAETRGMEPVEVGELAVEAVQPFDAEHRADGRSEEHTSELQSLMSSSYAGIGLKKKKQKKTNKRKKAKKQAQKEKETEE